MTERKRRADYTERHIEQRQNIEEKYKICISKDGITVEAPTRKDCIGLLLDALEIKRIHPIDRGIV